MKYILKEMKFLKLKLSVANLTPSNGWINGSTTCETILNFVNNYTYKTEQFVKYSRNLLLLGICFV